ncbi:MAG: family 16 glycoside hydrolase [Kofleriaceae bacterium]
MGFDGPGQCMVVVCAGLAACNAPGTSLDSDASVKTFDAALDAAAPCAGDFEGPVWTATTEPFDSPDDNWRVIYRGEGSVGTRESGDRRVYFGRSKPPTSPSGTVGNDTVGTAATQTLSTASFGNVRIELDMRTVAQLRTYDLQNDPPNAWEHAWVFFNYLDRWHHVYFYLGTNGYELGKKDNETMAEAQVFLRTGASVHDTIGSWQHLAIEIEEDRFQIWVNGVSTVDYTNDGSDGKLALSWRGGKLGFYGEDAEVEFDNVCITPL